jgi:Protein of unknown function (DUF1569)
MKSIFDTTTREELINRINAVSPQHTAQWGKMNAFQMVMHCTRCDDMFLGKLKINRVFIGRLIGKMILKKVLKDDAPFGKNSPTSSLLKTTTEDGDIEQQKKEWISRINQYADHADTNFVHPFFGPMTKEQVGLLSYKHTDHHLRQFGA